MTCNLSEIYMTGNIPIVINTDRIVDIHTAYIGTGTYTCINMAEDTIITDYSSPYEAGMAVYSGEFCLPTGAP